MYSGGSAYLARPAAGAGRDRFLSEFVGGLERSRQRGIQPRWATAHISKADDRRGIVGGC